MATRSILLPPVQRGDPASSCVGCGACLAKCLYCGIGMALVFGLSVCLYSQFWPETLTGIFTKDAAVIDMAAGYLRGYSIDCIIVSFVFCINSYFSGQGNSWFPMIHSLIATFLFRIPLSYLFGQLDPTDLQLMGYAPPLSTMVSLLICLWYLRRCRRKTSLNLGETAKSLRNVSSVTVLDERWRFRQDAAVAGVACQQPG